MGLKADGIMGLSPTAQNTEADLLIDEIADADLVPNKMFSLLIGDDEEQSKMTFGGYDPKFVREGGELEWHEIADRRYWTLELEGIKIGEREFAASVD